MVFKWRGHLGIRWHPLWIRRFLLKIFVVGVTLLQSIRFSHWFKFFVSACGWSLTAYWSGVWNGILYSCATATVGSTLKRWHILNIRMDLTCIHFYLNLDTWPYKMVKHKFWYAIGISENCCLFLQCCQCSHPFWHWNLFQLASLLLADK